MAAAMGFQMPGHGGVNIDILRPSSSGSAGANGSRLMLGGGLPNLAIPPAAQQRSGQPALPPLPPASSPTAASAPTAATSPSVDGSPTDGTATEAGDVGDGGIESFEAKMLAAAVSAKAKSKAKAKAKAAAAKAAEAAAETPKAKAKAKPKASSKRKGAGKTKASGVKAKGTGSTNSKGGNWACKT